MCTKKEFRTVRGYSLLKGEEEELSPSMEDYLEMIYRMCLDDGYARVNHLAERLHVQAPSVSRVLRKLTGKGLVSFRPYGIIQLTGKGREVGAYLLERHRTVERFLQLLGVKDNLLIDTELMEHNLSGNTLELLELLNAFFHENPSILNQFKTFKQDCLLPKEEEPG